MFIEVDGIDMIDVFDISNIFDAFNVFDIFGVFYAFDIPNVFESIFYDKCKHAKSKPLSKMALPQDPQIIDLYPYFL